MNTTKALRLTFVALACVVLNLVERQIIALRRKVSAPGKPLYDILHEIPVQDDIAHVLSTLNDLVIAWFVGASIWIGGIYEIGYTVATTMAIRFVTVVATQIPPPRACSYKRAPSAHGQCEELFPSGHMLWMAASTVFLTRRGVLSQSMGLSMLGLTGMIAVVVRNHYTIDVVGSIAFVLAFNTA